MPTLPSISDAEARVMEVLWAAHPLTAEQVLSKLAGQASWQPATVKTLLNRLLKKGAIAAEAEGRRFFYRPLLTRQDYIASESGSLLDRLFGGKVAPLVSHFAEQRKLSKRDVKELRRLLDELDHE
jgi:predicted transcriptional regulator